MSQAGTTAVAAVPFANLGQEILTDLKTAWADIESFGKEALTEVETVASTEYNALKVAGASVLGEFLPKQIALIQGWVTQYKQVAGAGNMTLLGAAEYCLAMDATAEVQFLNGELSLGLQTLSGAFLNSL